MARQRTGTLELRPNGYHARVTVDLPDGKTERRWVPLGTLDKARAARLLAKLLREIEAGRVVAQAKEAVQAAETVRDYATGWLSRRQAQGVLMVKDERGYFDREILPTLGDIPLVDVRPVNVRAVLDAAVAKGLARGSVSHVRRILFRMFKSAWQDEVIAENPVARVPMPAIREVRKERIILTDDEIGRFLTEASIDLELRVLSLVARAEGGMRTGDLNSWDWTMIDIVHFEQCTIPRAKTGTPQVLAIPVVLASVLRAWWQGQGSPTSGPVFPARRGRRKGGFKVKRGMTYAARLRLALLRAGVRRHDCTRPVDAEPVARGEACCPSMARDPLFAETATTKPVDFHSFRRAFASALAEADVTVQRAMHLAGHSDAKTHMRYVMRTTAMTQIPAAAIPQLNAETLPVLPRRVDESKKSHAELASNFSAPQRIRTSDLRLRRRDYESKNSAGVVACDESSALNPSETHPRFTLACDESARLDACKGSKRHSFDEPECSIIEIVAGEPAYEVWPEWFDA